MKIRGWVYIISNSGMPNLLKIGFSTKDPELRARELDSAGFPHPFKVEADFLVDNPRDVEQRAHSLLNHLREGKEWFRCNLSEAASAIKQSAEKIYLNESGQINVYSFNSENQNSPKTYDANKWRIKSCKKCKAFLHVTAWGKKYCYRCMGVSQLDLMGRDKAWFENKCSETGYIPEDIDPSEPNYHANKKRGEMTHCGGCGNPLLTISDGVPEECSYCKTGRFSDFQIWAKTPWKKS